MAASQMNAQMTYEFQYENANTMNKLESYGVILSQYPDDVIAAAKVALTEVFDDLKEGNRDFAHVLSSALSHFEKSKTWSKVSMDTFLKIR
jgi:TRAP-type mannitol/chloroaromatic compound transport system substrate-binding protein